MNADPTHHPHEWMAEVRNQSLGQVEVLWPEFLQDTQKTQLKNAVV